MYNDSNRRSGTGSGGSAGTDLNLGANYNGFQHFLSMLFGNGSNLFANTGNIVGSALGATGGSLINGILSGLGLDASFGGILQNLLNRWAGTGLTNADYESAELQRYLRSTNYSDQVKSMQEAGLNPAMLYNNGNGSSTPSLSLPSAGMSFSEMLQLPLLQAQIDNIKADTENKLSNAGLNKQRTLTEEQETRIRKIAADYGVELTELEIGQYTATIDRLQAESGLKRATSDLVKSQKEAQDITNSYLPRKFDAELKELASRSESESASAKLSLATKAMTDIQANFARENGFLMSPNDTLLVATYIASLLGLDKSALEDSINNGVSGLKGLLKPRGNSWRNSDGTYKRKSEPVSKRDFLPYGQRIG